MTAKLSKVSSLANKVISEVEKAVIGKRPLLEKIMAAILISGGHLLMEDYPGLGKTLIAKSFAQVLGLDFRRIQFTPDLLPSDITGGYMFNRNKNSFELHKGPIFANIILADEINRANKPRLAQNTVRPTGSNAGTTGHPRGRDNETPGTIHRYRHSKSS
jgi:MoxR-like ATPase